MPTIKTSNSWVIEELWVGKKHQNWNRIPLTDMHGGSAESTQENDLENVLGLQKNEMSRPETGAGVLLRMEEGGKKTKTTGRAQRTNT